MSTSYGAVVVGAGIVGASTAYHLARAGTATLLIDRNDAGRATDAGAGILSPATSSRAESEDWFALAREAAAYYPDLAAELEAAGAGPTSYERPGYLSVAVSADEVEPWEATVDRLEDLRDRYGTPAPGSVERLEAGAARERFPPLAEPERAFRYANGGRVDGRTFANALLEAGADHGLELESGDVTTIVVEDGAVGGVETAGGKRVDADAVVVAGGAWSGAFESQLGVEIPVEPQRGQIAHLAVPDADTSEWPIVSGFRGHYAVPWEGGRVAVGATREPAAGFDSRTTAAGVREVLDEALRLAPGLADAELEEIRVGLRPASADGLPVLGPVPGADGALLATGHGPTGLLLGPYSGTVVASLVRDEDVAVPTEPFSPDRFGRRTA